MPPIPDSTLPGHRQLNQRVTNALDLCQESRDIEFKESVSWEDLKFKIVTTGMGMANLRDGGVIIIGVGERGGTWSLGGINALHLASYDENDINDFVNRFASPPIRLELVTVTHRGTQFLAIKVPEFDRTPIVCKRSDPHGIREGAIYVRTIGKPQSTQAGKAEDIEDLLQLAAEKRAREFLSLARRVDMQPPHPDEQAFDEELGGL